MATNQDAPTGQVRTQLKREELTETAERAPTIAPILLKRKGLAAKLDCSLRTIDNLQAAGMPCIFIGRSRRFIADEVIAWLKRKQGR